MQDCIDCEHPIAENVDAHDPKRCSECAIEARNELDLSHCCCASLTSPVIDEYDHELVYGDPQCVHCGEVQ